MQLFPKPFIRLVINIVLDIIKCVFRLLEMRVETLVRSLLVEYPSLADFSEN
jgi:hypothetical protein